MKKFTKNITIPIFIFFLFFSTVFSCCLAGSAQAEMGCNAEQGKDSGSRCCPDKTKKVDSENNHECKCEKLAETLTVKEFNLSKTADSFGRFLDGTLYFSGKINASNEEFSQKPILRATTQVVKSDPPIYLRDSVFRL